MTATAPEAAAAGTISIGGDLVVRRLGFGSLRVSGIWGEPEDPALANRILRRAVELGINFIDTADAYGPEINERVVGEGLSPYPDDVIIATKGGLVRWGPGPYDEDRDGTPAHLREACEASLRRLKLERIDLYQFHHVDPAVPIEESIGALADLQAEGKIRHIGVSNVDVEQLERARSTAVIVSVQNRFNLLRRESAEVLAVCVRDGLAFIAWHPLAAGQLAAPTAPHADVARTLGATPAQVALAWLLKRSPAIVPIPGSGSLADLEQNVGAARIALDEELMARLEGLSEVHE